MKDVPFSIGAIFDFSGSIANKVGKAPEAALQMRGARNSTRALLILSDGGDNHSRYNESDIKRLVREADTRLYVIGIFDPLSAEDV